MFWLFILVDACHSEWPDFLEPRKNDFIPLKVLSILLMYPCHAEWSEVCDAVDDILVLIRLLMYSCHTKWFKVTHEG